LLSNYLFTYDKAQSVENSSDLLPFFRIRSIIFIMKEDVKYKKQQQLNKLKADLPDYVKEYISYCEGTLNRSYNTMISYTYNIRQFFQFLIDQNPLISGYDDITIDMLNQIEALDMQDYMSYLRLHKSETKTIQNEAKSRAQRLSCMRHFFQYLSIYKGLSVNTAKLLDRPKAHSKKKQPLTSEETVELLNNVKACVGKPESSFYLENTKYRNIAIITTLAYTGIRVSELCNLNLDDIHRDTMTIHVTRKGGDDDEVIINDEVRKAIDRYIDFERQPYDDANRALFLSSRHATGERLSVRSVERMIKAYGDTIGEHVTPHTLRRTFGTKLYNQTGDLYLTATALGHKNIQTTKDFYTTMSEERKQLIRGINYEETNKSEENKED
jgi:integrase/recombinase XerC